MLNINIENFNINEFIKNKNNKQSIYNAKYKYCNITRYILYYLTKTNIKKINFIIDNFDNIDIQKMKYIQ